mmetsp:Transcript_336/g.449  ORF Transcript_336/g.449 Transcript_336/m.449 type:complete len:89 (+) Transcript_336:233-499(+)
MRLLWSPAAIICRHPSATTTLAVFCHHDAVVGRRVSFWDPWIEEKPFRFNELAAPHLIAFGIGLHPTCHLPSTIISAYKQMCVCMYDI